MLIFRLHAGIFTNTTDDQAFRKRLGAAFRDIEELSTHAQFLRDTANKKFAFMKLKEFSKQEQDKDTLFRQLKELSKQMRGNRHVYGDGSSAVVGFTRFQ